MATTTGNSDTGITIACHVVPGLAIGGTQPSATPSIDDALLPVTVGPAPVPTAPAPLHVSSPSLIPAAP